jgi:hypothetical protein
MRRLVLVVVNAILYATKAATARQGIREARRGRKTCSSIVGQAEPTQSG